MALWKEKKKKKAKGLIAELAPPHVQSDWGSRGERVRVVGLAACCNYSSKKKKKKLKVLALWDLDLMVIFSSALIIVWVFFSFFPYFFIDNN